MVVFTCSYCGESVKKNQVEKHYSITSCRFSTPALTCVDCLKDFNGKEHVAHTSCVTEEERYSAKGFVSKPPGQKGKRKQEDWVSFIQKTVESDACLDRSVKNILERLAKDPGVPQKRKKFINFCKSKLGPWFNLDIVDKTWSFLEKKRSEFQTLRNEDRKRKRTDSRNECTVEYPENGITDENKHKPENSKKKKKHDVQDNSAEPQNDVEVDANAEAESKKQKKKKKSSFSNGDSVIEHENCNDITEGSVNDIIGEKDISEGVKENESLNLLSKKEKKEKRKKEKYEKQLLEIQNEPVHDGAEEENNEETSQKSKKKKKKEKHLENGVVKDLEDTTIKTASKKKPKQEQEIEVIENNEAELEEAVEAKPGKFNWEETVVKVLESKGELPLKRLEKKVVNEYINSGVHVESVEKVIAKFNKKILKMSTVKVKKDIVKLAS